MSGKLIYRAQPESVKHTCKPWLEFHVSPWPDNPEADPWFDPTTMVYPGSRWQCGDCLTIWVAHEVGGWQMETRQEHEAWRQYQLGKRPRPPVRESFASGVSTPSSAVSAATGVVLEPDEFKIDLRGSSEHWPQRP